MPKDFPRARRIADQIQRELAELIRVELKDPRVPGLVTVTAVEVSSDQSHAKVFFTLLGDESRIEEATTGLRSAAGFLRTQLGHRMNLRVVPQLDFKYDTSVERGVRLSHLIDQAVASKQVKEE